MFSIHQLTYRPQSASAFNLNVPEFSWNGKGVLAIVGSNGSGKSSLMGTMAGLKNQRRGPVLLPVIIPILATIRSSFVFLL